MKFNALAYFFKDYQDQYGIDLAEELKASYVTPYELVNVIKTKDAAKSNCPITYKSSATKEKIISRMSSIKNIPPFVPSKKVIEMKKRGKSMYMKTGVLIETGVFI